MQEELNQKDVSKRFFKAIESAIGSEMTQRVLNRYIEIRKSFQMPENPYLRMHLQEGILPGLALYREICQTEPDQKIALEKTDKVLEFIAHSKRKQMKAFGNLPIIYPVLRVYIKYEMKRYPSCGWQTEWKENSPEAIRFDMHSCFYQDTLTNLGAPELTASFCKLDDFVYSDKSPYLIWQRTKTIGRGDDLCDFCFLNAKRIPSTQA